MSITPGPWETADDFNHEEVKGVDMCSIVSRDGTYIAHIQDAVEYEDNARAIAELPTLLATLEELSDLAVWMTGAADFTKHDYYMAHKDVITEAIELCRRAKGEEG